LKISLSKEFLFLHSWKDKKNLLFCLNCLPNRVLGLRQSQRSIKGDKRFSKFYEKKSPETRNQLPSDHLIDDINYVSSDIDDFDMKVPEIIKDDGINMKDVDFF